MTWWSAHKKNKLFLNFWDIIHLRDLTEYPAELNLEANCAICFFDDRVLPTVNPRNFMLQILLI